MWLHIFRHKILIDIQKVLLKILIIYFTTLNHSSLNFCWHVLFENKIWFKFLSPEWKILNTIPELDILFSLIFALRRGIYGVLSPLKTCCRLKRQKKDKKINPAIDLRLKFWCRSWRSPFCGLRLFEAKKFNNVVQNSHQTINVFDEPGRFQIIDCICSVGIMLHSWIFFQTVCSDSIRVHHSWIRSLVSWNNILEQWHGKKLGTFLAMTFR